MCGLIDVLFLSSARHCPLFSRNSLAIFCAMFLRRSRCPWTCFLFVVICRSLYSPVKCRCGTLSLYSSSYVFTQSPVSLMTHWCVLSTLLAWSFPSFSFIFLVTLITIMSNICVDGVRHIKWNSEEVKFWVQPGSKRCVVSSGGNSYWNFHNIYFSTSWVTVSF